MHIIRFQLTPAQRAELPLGVGANLMAVATTLDHISAKAAR